MSKTTPPTPALTTDQLYQQLEAEALKEGARGEKGVKIKNATEKIVKEIGKKKLVFRVLYSMLCERTRLDFVPKRSHFMRICRQNWEVSEDADGLIWVDLSKPKIPKSIV
jgi:hypothetical protein